MRLLNSTTLELGEFFDADVPPYAILSHTWGIDEVTYQEMKSMTHRISRKAGFLKIQRCARLAKSKGYDYIWIDTCCIDKSSSAELSEAINSMYSWYKRSEVCFAYLSDVSIGFEWDEAFYDERTARAMDIKLGFSSSRWMTRGWTLQELIAPKNLLFYDSDMRFIGDKRFLIRTLSEITRISTSVLSSCDTSAASVADRMSWAADRKTTRLEDMAYCLLGIFNINMPLLYGEGDKAFVRLQEEILRISDDHSLFTWKATADSRFTYRGLLARNPNEFRQEDGGSFKRSEVYDSASYSITNKGIQMTVPLAPWREVKLDYLESQSSNLKSRFEFEDPEKEGGADRNFEDDYYFVAILNYDYYYPLVPFQYNSIGIILVRLLGQDQYARADADLLVLHLNPKQFEMKPIFVRQNVQVPVDHCSSRLFAFHISHDIALHLPRRQISAASLDQPLEFNTDVASSNIFKLRSLSSQDGTSRVLILHLRARVSQRPLFGMMSARTTGLRDEDLSSSGWADIGNASKKSRYWDGVVTIILKWESRYGTYSCQFLYSLHGMAAEDLAEKARLQRADIGRHNAITLPSLSLDPIRLFVDMETMLVEDRLVIAVYLKEVLGNSLPSRSSIRS